MKQNDLQVSCLMVWNTETMNEVEIEDIKQSKYPIIYDFPEAFVGANKMYTYYCCYYFIHVIQSSLGMVRIQKSLQ